MHQCNLYDDYQIINNLIEVIIAIRIRFLQDHELTLDAFFIFMYNMKNLSLFIFKILNFINI